MSRTLSPLQEAINLRLSHLERISETRLRDYLATYFRGLDVSDDAWCKEFALALELLVLYGHVRIEEHPRKGRVLIDTRRAVPQAKPSLLDTHRDEQTSEISKTGPWPIAACAATVVLAAGCTLLPLSESSLQPKQVAQLPVYGDGSSFPSRIEQFFNGRSMVYRYCQDDECPSPTPKVAAASQHVDSPRYEPAASQRQAAVRGAAQGVAAIGTAKIAQASMPMVKPTATLVAAVSEGIERVGTSTVGSAASQRHAAAQGAAQGVAAIGTEKMAQVSMPIAKPTATLVAAALGGIKGAGASAVGATAPNMLATLTNKETPTAGMALRSDGEFTSYKGMVGFQQGSMVLDGLSRQKVAELAPAARDAERVRLRGKVATTQLSEEMKKLAVGRAFAVKIEFVKHNVGKDKIRIMSPQQPSGDNATGSVRGVDVMLDMPEKKVLSGMVKDGA